MPVINPVSEKSNPGMAANVFENVQSLSPNSDVMFATQLSQVTKKRYVDATSGYILLRVDEGDQFVDKLTLKKLDTHFINRKVHPKSFDFVLISDYNKGFVTEDVIKEIVELFSHYKVPLFLDTKKILGEWSRGIDFVKINEKEYKEQLKHSDKPTDFCKNLIVTLGDKGSKWINENVTAIGKTIEVRDVSGAGDTYFAAFAIKYTETKNVVEAMQYANKASAIAVSKHGVVAVQQSEIT